MATDPNASNLKIVLIGDKAKAMLAKLVFCIKLILKKIRNLN
jgi:hypothetical protein